MALVKARPEDLESCVDILFASELGRNYYPNRETLRAEVERGMESDQLYVKKITGGGYTDNEVTGVIWYQREGMFHSFPYLHMIAVKEPYRRQGIGAEMMDFFEQDVLLRGKNHLRTKVFLTVGDFNPGARQFYLGRGYTELADFPGLFRRGITETLLMKKVTSAR